MEKQYEWLESVQTMTVCCQYAACGKEHSEVQDEMLSYAMNWASIKHKALTQAIAEGDVSKIENWQVYYSVLLDIHLELFFNTTYKLMM